ncbi:MAG: hypothetical protein H6Q38_2331, partial [Chloroflexi bacterium]|nr:hypothetical protein [Chloroflexota bacterium]
EVMKTLDAPVPKCVLGLIDLFGFLGPGSIYRVTFIVEEDGQIRKYLGHLLILVMTRIANCNPI